MADNFNEQELQALFNRHLPMKQMPPEFAARLRKQVLAEVANTLQSTQYAAETAEEMSLEPSVVSNEQPLQPYVRQATSTREESTGVGKGVLAWLAERLRLAPSFAMAGATLVALWALIWWGPLIFDQFINGNQPSSGAPGVLPSSTFATDPLTQTSTPIVIATETANAEASLVGTETPIADETATIVSSSNGNGDDAQPTATEDNRLASVPDAASTPVSTSITDEDETVDNRATSTATTFSSFGNDDDFPPTSSAQAVSTSEASETNDATPTRRQPTATAVLSAEGIDEDDNSRNDGETPVSSATATRRFTATPTKGANTPTRTHTPSDGTELGRARATSTPASTATRVPSRTATVDSIEDSLVATATSFVPTKEEPQMLPTVVPFTLTPTPVPTQTKVRTPTATTVVVSPTLRPVPTKTRTPTRTSTWTPTKTPTLTNTRTPLPTATNTPRPTATPTWTPLPTATNTPRPTATPTWTPLPTATNTPRPTATPTWTPLPTATNTPRPTATPTWTPLPTATNTPLPTATNTATATNTPLPTATNTATATNTPLPTATNTATATNTPLPTATNSPPQATVLQRSVDEDDSVVIPLRSALQDADGDQLTIIQISQPGHGILEVQQQGEGIVYIYKPSKDYVGTDSFTYLVTDGFAQITGQVNLIVNPKNDPPQFTGPILNQFVEANTELDVMVEAADVDVGDILTFSLDPSKSPVWLLIENLGNGQARIIGTPGADDVGTFTVEVIVRDNIGAEDRVEFTVEVSPGGPVSGDSDVNAAGVIDANPNTPPIDNSLPLTTTTEISGTVTTSSP